MNSIKNLHREAMDLAESAFSAKLKGEVELANHFLKQAFEKERKAAELAAHDLSVEPTRSTLHRSAASLAVDCGEFREAQRLIATALAGNPPNEIADELRELLQQVNSRHLAGERSAALIEKSQPTSKLKNRVSIKGQLLYADLTKSSRGEIRLVDKKGKKHVVRVPDGMMGNIVKPLWENTVVVTGVRVGKTIQLMNIMKTNE